MTIILTGSSGFIGSNFKKKLNKKNEIICVEKDNCFDFINNINKIKKIDLILHQGAISNTKENNIEYIYKYNVDFTLKLFKIAIEREIPIKYASSASVYGNNLNVINCKNNINPLNQYAISKLQIDYWVKDNINKFKLIQGFRYFNVYGKGENKKKDQASPISKFAKQIKQTGKLKLFEGSENIFRDFICVDDLINIVLNNNKKSGIYDLGTSNPISFFDVAKIICKKYNGKIEKINFPKELINKYQKYTCAQKEWDYNFKTVKEYVL